MSLDELVNAVSAWVKSVRPGAELAVRGLADPDTSGISLRVLALRGTNDSRHVLARRDPVIDVLEVDLLLSVGDQPAGAAATAADLHFAALEAAPPFTLNTNADALEIARGLGLAPAIGIVLRGRIARERVAKPVPLVREAKFELVPKEVAEGGRSPPAPATPEPAEPSSSATPTRRRIPRRGGA
jgi:hypothetical protein